MKNILIVITSHKVLGTTGRETGVWLEEFTAPYYLFKDAGWHITVASPRGGHAPIDPESMKLKALGKSGRRFVKERSTALDNLPPLRDVAGQAFDALYYPGGHGPMWDLSSDPLNAELLEKIFDSCRIVGAVCHGPAALLAARRCDGQPLVYQRKVTGFTNAEEEAMGLEKVVPFLLEDKLKEQGASYSKAGKFRRHVVIDGNLVTGQNPRSAERVGETMLEILKSSEAN